MALPNRQSNSIEFIVKPKQDLHLEGSLRRLPRVAKGEPYPCQMQKSQSFSCLFRHYAKHNGLRKEDLVFSFVDELLPDQTPETVHLMPQDEILVEHRSFKEEAEVKPLYKEDVFAQQFRALLESGDHADVTFVVSSPPNNTSSGGNNSRISSTISSCRSSGGNACSSSSSSNTSVSSNDGTFDGVVKIASDGGEYAVVLTEEIRAHKAILSARSEYFGAMFRMGGMRESTKDTIPIEHDAPTFQRMLEFIYTNDVKDLRNNACQPNDVILLLMLANEYLLDNLRVLCEATACKIITIQNIGRLLLLSSHHNASKLRTACLQFVHDNRIALLQDQTFRQQIESTPELGLLILESAFSKGGSSDGMNGAGYGMGGGSGSSSSAMIGDDGQHSAKRRRISNTEAHSDNESEMVPPQAGTSNTIAQPGANGVDM